MVRCYNAPRTEHLKNSICGAEDALRPAHDQAGRGRLAGFAGASGAAAGRAGRSRGALGGSRPDLSIQERHAAGPEQPAPGLRPSARAGWLAEDTLSRPAPHRGFADSQPRHSGDRCIQDSGALQARHHHGYLRAPVQRDAGRGGAVDG